MKLQLITRFPLNRIYLPVLLLMPLLFIGCSDREQGGDPYGEAEAGELDIGDRRGALVDEVVFTEERDPGRVTNLIERGSLQVYATGITNSTVFRRLRDSAHADHDISYGSSGELTINPAGPEFNDGRLNPFHVREIREALNWLVNRRHIAEEIYGGLAVPRPLPINTTFPDYARLAETVRTLELKYAYDPDRAREVIHREMGNLGATYENGRWMHNGEPIEISVLIRTDDERRRVGDYVANLMEDLGFRAERLYRAADEASRIWISGDPNDGRWHLYTGGWVSLSINRDLAGNLSDYYTPRGRPEPLWQIYDPDPEFDELADRLQRRDYESWDERQEMMARGIEMAMKESYRIWLVDQIQVWPRSRNVRLSPDLAGGISGSSLWPYTLRYNDRLGGRVIMGLPNLLTEPWNPVAGTNWIFDQMIQRSLNDPPFLSDPFTGLYWPQQVASAEVTVAEGVSALRTHDWLTLETVPEIEVPEDVWISWDAEEARFITAGEEHPDGITARTRVVLRYEEDYFERTWHDGTTVSVADLITPWILQFERADENSRLFDPTHVPRFEVYRRTFRGWRINSTDPLEIEAYSDQIYPDAEWIAAQRAPVLGPWHTLALGIRAELNGDLAFSTQKADQRRIDWMSYISGPSLPIFDLHLARARETDYLPFAEALSEYVTEAEINERYAALADWRKERRHFLVGNGPFYLHSAHPVERNVVIRRFEDFPDPAGKWLRFTRAEVPAADIDGPLVIDSGEPTTFDLRIHFEGEPYPEEGIDMVRYMLFDGGGNKVAEGDAERAGKNGRWRIDVGSEEMDALGTGANSLEVAISSNRVALPTFVTHGFATVPR